MTDPCVGSVPTSTRAGCARASVGASVLGTAGKSCSLSGHALHGGIVIERACQVEEGSTSTQHRARTFAHLPASHACNVPATLLATPPCPQQHTRPRHLRICRSRMPHIARHTSSRTHAYMLKFINRVIAPSQVLGAGGVSVTVLAGKPHSVARA